MDEIANIRQALGSDSTWSCQLPYELLDELANYLNTYEYSVQHMGLRLAHFLDEFVPDARIDALNDMLEVAMRDSRGLRDCVVIVMKGSS